MFDPISSQERAERSKFQHFTTQFLGNIVKLDLWIFHRFVDSNSTLTCATRKALDLNWIYSLQSLITNVLSHADGKKDLVKMFPILNRLLRTF